jgi:orotate phosphoribosyltransferase-like protein
MGLLRTTWGGPRPSVDVLKIKELYLKGVDVAQIADEMHCSRTTVYYWLQLKKHRGIVEAE